MPSDFRQKIRVPAIRFYNYLVRDAYQTKPWVTSSLGTIASPPGLERRDPKSICQSLEKNDLQQCARALLPLLQNAALRGIFVT